MLDRDQVREAYQALYDLLPGADMLKLNAEQRRRIDRTMRLLWNRAPSGKETGPKQLD